MPNIVERVNERKVIYMKSLLSDILLLQEHWLLENGKIKLEQNFKDCDVYFKCGVDSSSLLYGRPYGGCAAQTFKWN